MTIGLSEQPSLREPVDDTERHLSAVADKLTAYGIRDRLAMDSSIPTLLATSRSGRADADISMDSGTWLQAAWASAPGSDPATTAGAILAVLKVISPGITSTAAKPAAW